MRLIAVLERACGREALKVLEDMQPGDVKDTYADIEASRRDLGCEPSTTIEEGDHYARPRTHYPDLGMSGRTRQLIGAPASLALIVAMALGWCALWIAVPVA